MGETIKPNWRDTLKKLVGKDRPKKSIDPVKVADAILDGPAPRRKVKLKGNLQKPKNWRAKRKAKIKAQKVARRLNRR